MKARNLITCLLFLLPSLISAQVQSVIQDGEVLQYKVKWSFFRLGTITVRTLLSQSESGNKSYKVSMRVQSNPYLPFISIDEINESIIDVANGMSKSFYGKYMSGDNAFEIECIYRDAEREAIYTHRNCKTNNYPRIEIIRDIDPYLDGPTLFLFSRSHIHSNRTYRMPTMIEGKINQTILRFNDALEFIEVEAFDETIMVKRYDGFADWNGGTEAGLSGQFFGWISADSAAVLVRAEMKVILGHIVTELEEYEKPGWDPPFVKSTANLNKEM